jgi:ABC-type sugar transport system ATPase subunit
MTKPIFHVRNLSVHSGRQILLDSVTLEIPQGGVFGLIGPSGAGKSTLLKSFNRMLDLTPGLRVSGQIDFHGSPLYHHSVDPDALRARIGMLFQQPVIFPGSILSNVTFGVRHHGTVRRRDLPHVAEKALRDACLWEEVKDRLRSAADQCLGSALDRGSGRSDPRPGEGHHHHPRNAQPLPGGQGLQLRGTSCFRETRDGGARVGFAALSNRMGGLVRCASNHFPGAHPSLQGLALGRSAARTFEGTKPEVHHVERRRAGLW